MSGFCSANHFSAPASARKRTIQNAMMPSPIRMSQESRRRGIDVLFRRLAPRCVRVIRSCQESWSSSRKHQAYPNPNDAHDSSDASTRHRRRLREAGSPSNRVTSQLGQPQSRSGFRITPKTHIGKPATAPPPAQLPFRPRSATAGPHSSGRKCIRTPPAQSRPPPHQSPRQQSPRKRRRLQRHIQPREPVCLVLD